MSNWQIIMDLSDSAMKLMQINLEEGQSEFEKLLDKFGNDGMIFYKRAQAYEKLGLFDQAANDYGLAKMLFPLKTWKDAAENGLWRTGGR